MTLLKVNGSIRIPNTGISSFWKVEITPLCFVPFLLTEEIGRGFSTFTKKDEKHVEHLFCSEPLYRQHTLGAVESGTSRALSCIW